MSVHYDVYLTFSDSCLIFNSSQVRWGRDLRDGALEREGTTTPQLLEVRGSSRSDRQKDSKEGKTAVLGRIVPILLNINACIYKYLMRIFF